MRWIKYSDDRFIGIGFGTGRFDHEFVGIAIASNASDLYERMRNKREQREGEREGERERERESKEREREERDKKRLLYDF